MAANETTQSSAEVPRSYTDYRVSERVRLALFVIDPQYDFHPGGSLAIPTANDDSERIGGFISQNKAEIDDIIVSLDTHQKLHIAHSLFWENENGDHPDPFTIISANDVESGVWRTTDARWREWGLNYVKGLEANKRFALCIWPEHCLLGSTGHAVVKPVYDACMEWAHSKKTTIEYVLKGNNMLTEHYSAMQADVAREDDPRTLFNQALFDRLMQADRVIICGEALSHCVAFTTRDIVAKLSTPAERARIVVFEDCASPVPGFEEAAETFLRDMRELGVTVCKSSEFSL